MCDSNSTITWALNKECDRLRQALSEVAWPHTQPSKEPSKLRESHWVIILPKSNEQPSPEMSRPVYTDNRFCFDACRHKTRWGKIKNDRSRKVTSSRVNIQNPVGKQAPVAWHLYRSVIFSEGAHLGFEQQINWEMLCAWYFDLEPDVPKGPPITSSSLPGNPSSRYMGIVHQTRNHQSKC